MISARIKELIVPVIVPGLFIFILCLLPGSAFPDVSWSAIMQPDKWVHFALYAAWAVVWRRSAPNTAVFLIILVLVFWGGFIELFQEYILSYRSGEWLDWLADIAGSLAGILFSKVILKT